MALPPFEPYALPTAAELPTAAVRWRPAASRAALLIHDMQGYFVRAFGAHASPIQPVIANIEAIRTQCDRAGVPVFYTAQPGRQDPRERGLQAAFWGPGMSDAPADQHIVPALAPRDGHTVVTKWRYSAFRKSDFGERLRAQGRDQLIVTGIFAHIGCMMTCADAFMCDVEPFLIADAVGDFSRAHHDQAVTWVGGRCGVVLTTAALIDVLGGDRSS